MPATLPGPHPHVLGTLASCAGRRSSWGRVPSPGVRAPITLNQEGFKSFQHLLISYKAIFSTSTPHIYCKGKEKEEANLVRRGISAQTTKGT